MSAIPWTDETWNPIRARRKDTGKVGWHCVPVSEACQNCYAWIFNLRNLPNGGTGLDYGLSGLDQVEIFLDADFLKKPLHWKRPRNIFPCSMTDLFADFVVDEFIAEMWRTMYFTKRHTYQVLTKRPERMMEIMPRLVATFGVLPNVILGVTAENQDRAEERIPLLLACEAAGYFVSYEPGLGPIDFDRWLYPVERIDCPNCGALHVDGADGKPFDRIPHHKHLCHDCGQIFDNSVHSYGGLQPRPALSWVIVGGESGPRPFDLKWARNTIAQCKAAGVPVFVKQLGSVPMISESDWRAGAEASAGCVHLLSARNKDKVPSGMVPLKLNDHKGENWDEWSEDLCERELPEVCR